MARALGIDFGFKRTGLAVTDPLRICVNRLETIASETLDQFLDDYLKKEEVDLIVFGDPFHNDGTATPVSVEVHEKARKLKIKYPGLNIDFQDEQGTSRKAVRVLIDKGTPQSKRNKTAIDQMSAVLILQEYLKHY